MNPKSYQLHHYTSEFDTLKLILANDGGFWPRYSMEHFSWSQPDRKSHYLAFPCACFCDLPFEANAMHRADYGPYVISFDKSSDLANHLTPVIYVNEEGPLAEMIRVEHSNHLRCFGQAVATPHDVIHFESTALDRDALGELWTFLPYLKSALGYTLRRRPPPQNGCEYERMPGYDYEWVTKPLEEEFEWRYVPPKHRDALYCFADYDRRSIMDRDALSEGTKDSFLKFSHEEVQGVIVKDNFQREEIVRIHRCLEKKVKTWEEIPGADDGAD